MWRVRVAEKKVAGHDASKIVEDSCRDSCGYCAADVQTARVQFVAVVTTVVAADLRDLRDTAAVVDSLDVYDRVDRQRYRFADAGVRQAYVRHQYTVRESRQGLFG